MPVNSPTIEQKSATSTEVWLFPVQGKDTDGSFVDPTAATVSVAALRAPDEAGDTRAPATVDYGTAAWETWTGPRYMVAFLFGPAGDVDHEDPTDAEDGVLHEIWVRLESGSEDVRKRVGFVTITP